MLTGISPSRFAKLTISACPRKRDACCLYGSEKYQMCLLLSLQLLQDIQCFQGMRFHHSPYSLSRKVLLVCVTPWEEINIFKKKKNSLTNPPYQGIHVLHIPLSWWEPSPLAMIFFLGLNLRSHLLQFLFLFFWDILLGVGGPCKSGPG